ncbi:MAG: Segregation and condensation protein A [Gammaproteobacteria bacterium]|nr:Segregation and condensation protein A [Gammaproteobacteria bacterium]
MTDNQELQTERDPGLRAVVRGEDFVQWPRDLYIPPDALEVILDAFEGPLDLLLYLIRKQNLDILDIPVARITGQYMEYVELMQAAKLDLAAEYLVMAAMLAEIKSRMLLPHQEEEEDEEDPRAALVKRLREYERFREAAYELEERPRVGRDVFVAFAKHADHVPEEQLPQVTLDDLAVAFRHVVERVDHLKSLNITREVLSMRERMTIVLNTLQTQDFVRFESLFGKHEGRTGLVVTFVAILELMKDEMIVAVQNEPFASLHIRSAA